MILGIIIGIISCLFTLVIIGMYLKITKKLDQLINGVYYLVKREYEFEQSEIEISKEAQRKEEQFKRVSQN